MILVTGGAGFIGGHLAESFVRNAHADGIANVLVQLQNLFDLLDEDLLAAGVDAD